MRTIPVSTGVFARIWAAREPGEETEDAILSRLLPGTKLDSERRDKPNSQHQPPASEGGILDRRSGVLFSEGFEIFRTYLGSEYQARVTGDRWLLTHNGQQCSTLNELSQAIGTKGENAWVNWLHCAPSGAPRPISELRDPNKITRRNGTNLAKKLGMPEA
jgi:hypothetical protein